MTRSQQSHSWATLDGGSSRPESEHPWSRQNQEASANQSPGTLSASTPSVKARAGGGGVTMLVYLTGWFYT